MPHPVKEKIDRVEFRPIGTGCFQGPCALPPRTHWHRTVDSKKWQGQALLVRRFGVFALPNPRSSNPGRLWLVCPYPPLHAPDFLNPASGGKTILQIVSILICWAAVSMSVLSRYNKALLMMSTENGFPCAG